jgi:hypothetical protein
MGLIGKPGQALGVSVRSSAHQSHDDVRTKLAYLARAAICVTWGTTYRAIKICLETISPALMGGLRYVTAAAILSAALLPSVRVGWVLGSICSKREGLVSDPLTSAAMEIRTQSSAGVVSCRFMPTSIRSERSALGHFCSMSPSRFGSSSRSL